MRHLQKHAPPAIVCTTCSQTATHHSHAVQRATTQPRNHFDMVARSGKVRHEIMWHVMVWYDMSCHGMVWCGVVIARACVVAFLPRMESTKSLLAPSLVRSTVAWSLFLGTACHVGTGADVEAGADVDADVEPCEVRRQSQFLHCAPFFQNDAKTWI